eukprot:442213-Hanusia_phi.AAC.1
MDPSSQIHHPSCIPHPYFQLCTGKTHSTPPSPPSMSIWTCTHIAAPAFQPEAQGAGERERKGREQG